ncbi:MAG: polysaccharide biosynthesis/export family protein [Gammaproteobacteria bacterium]|nr:polysaccharide biosynthesis/export family protein [Gammaproteobacteria bacterium]
MGCVIAPGMHMSTPPRVPGVKITPITPDTIRAQGINESSGAVAKPNLPGNMNDKEYQYHIGPRDVLAVTVWDHPELTIPAGQFRDPEVAGHLVAEDGTIFFPYAGTVHVAGKTTAEVRNILTQGIAQVIQDPQLDVKVVAFRSQKAYVSGEVSKPGPQPITDVPLTVAEAISLAGDLTPDADLANVTLTRDGKAQNINLLAMYDKGDVRQNILLTNRDILHVPDRNTQKVFVMGEVANPSSIVMHKRGITLTEAIGDAGGVDPVTSDPTQVYVIRGNENESEIYYLDAKSPDALILGDQFRLKPRDVVYVETAEVTRWNRVIEQIVPTSQIIRNLGRVTGAE